MANKVAVKRRLKAHQFLRDRDAKHGLNALAHEAHFIDACREHLLCYGKTLWPDLETPPHLRLLARELTNILNRTTRNLIITMPPRHGKTLLAAQFFPGWFLGHFPHRQIIYATYSQERAADVGRQVRNMLKDEVHQRIFPKSVIADDSEAAHRFNFIAQGSAPPGGYFAVGRGGPLTGRGADILLIDDPIKDAEEASSPTIQRRLIEWYQSTALTRLMPGGSQIIIQTRWHKRDLVGHILENDANNWRIVNLPAIDDDGKALWPARYNEKALAEIRRNVGDYYWSAMYQQRPVDRSTSIFRVESLMYADEPGHRTLPRVRYWDRAATEQQGSGDPDYTVGLKMAYDADNDCYIIEDIARFRAQPAEVYRRILATAERDGVGVKQVLEEDPGQAGKFEIDAYRTALRGYPFSANRPTGSKEIRANPAAIAMEAERVCVLRLPWTDHFITELMEFPHGRHDDQVDAFSGAFNQLSRHAKSSLTGSIPIRTVAPAGQNNSWSSW